MTESSRQKARRVFMEIADLAREKREGALLRMCGDDHALRAEVSALLAADEGAGGFMASPTGRAPDAIASAPTIAGASREHEGQMIDRYKLLQPIGEGGFGTVWMAEQREPVKRRVALKVIKLGMDTKQVIARFEAERQALAMMDHPNIAKVLDAGSTETGRPYFVMEYIKGVPMVEYCDTERLDTRARLDLFTSVCHAIQHAHQKGIIHRDIKSSNVLVTMHDGVPVPKVIDFGIAKATSAELTHKTLFTEHRQMIGTPAYMSPEQAEMSGLDIDTRSDVYSLGVLLYELLTGTTPFGADELLSKGFAEMMRIIREVEPHKPSTRMSSLGATASGTVKQRRGADAAALSSALRGDLDWIVMKCLEKDRTRRYDTASSLAADIRRHLSDEPVSAGPPSTSYKLHKFIRRNRGQVVAGAVVAGALVLGVIGTSLGMAWALNERARANNAAEAEGNARREAQDNEQKALAEARRSQTVTEFVRTALEAGDAHFEGGGQSTTILEAMARAERDIESGRFKDDPETESMLQTTIAQILTNNGRLQEGEALQRRALDTLRAIHKTDAYNLGAGINSLAKILSYSDRPVEAEPLHREALAIMQRLKPGDNSVVALCMNNLGYSLMLQARHAEAEEWFKKAIEMEERLHTAESPSLAKSIDNLSKTVFALGRFDEADALAVRALEMRERLYKGDHPDLAVGIATVADIHRQIGKREEADELARRSLEMNRRLFKGDTDFLGEALIRYGRTRADLQAVGEAEALFKEALALYERLEGPNGNGTKSARNALGLLYLWTRRFQQSESVFAVAVEHARAAAEGDSEALAGALEGLGRAKFQLGRGEEGLALATRALEMRRKVLPSDHAEIFGNLQVVGGMLGQLDRTAEAEPFLSEAVAMGSRLFSETAPPLLSARESLATNHWRSGKLDLSVPEFEAALAIRTRTLGADHPDTLGTAANLGVNYKDAGRIADAIRLLEPAVAAVAENPRLAFAGPALLEAYSLATDAPTPQRSARVASLVRELLPSVREELAPNSAELASALAQLSTALLKASVWDEAEPLARECLRIREAGAPDEWSTFNTRSVLGGVLLGQKKYAEAEPLLLTGYEGLKAREATMPPPAKVRIADALDRLVALYTATGDAAEAAKWTARR